MVSEASIDVFPFPVRSADLYRTPESCERTRVGRLAELRDRLGLSCCRSDSLDAEALSDDSRAAA
jgi:hypothetical protein